MVLPLIPEIYASSSETLFSRLETRSSCSCIEQERTRPTNKIAAIFSIKNKRWRPIGYSHLLFAFAANIV